MPCYLIIEWHTKAGNISHFFRQPVAYRSCEFEPRPSDSQSDVTTTRPWEPLKIINPTFWSKHLPVYKMGQTPKNEHHFFCHKFLLVKIGCVTLM